MRRQPSNKKTIEIKKSRRYDRWSNSNWNAKAKKLFDRPAYSMNRGDTK